MRHGTGIGRLDDLLQGGIPDKGSAVVYGAPFSGKRILGRRFLLEGLQAGKPGVLVLTDGSATEASAELAAMDPKVPEYEANGLLFYLDAYSKPIGLDDAHTGAHYLDGVGNLSSFVKGMNEVHGAVLTKSDGHRLVFDSLTALLVQSSASASYRFLQVFMGRARRAGATGLYLLEEGIHDAADIQLVKHLMTGMLELRSDKDKRLLYADGLGLGKNPGWVEYNMGENSFEVTGSFATGRIK